MTQQTTAHPVACATPAAYSDTQLMARYRDTRDLHAMEALVDRNRDKFIGSIRRRYGLRLRGVEPEDIVQEAFVNICRYPDQFRDEAEDSFAAWSGGILRNVVNSWTRKAMRSSAKSRLTSELVASVADDGPGPAEVVEAREAAQVVDDAYLILMMLYRSAFERLSPSAQELLSWVELDAVPYGEIGARLGVRSQAVKVRVFRARRRVWQGVGERLAASAARSEVAA